MLKIVMDSAGEIPDDWRSEYEVEEIPVNIQFEKKKGVFNIKKN